MTKIIQVRCPHCQGILGVEIPSLQTDRIVARPPSGDVMFTNDMTNNSNLVSDQERRASIQRWLAEPKRDGPDIGYSNLESEKTGIGQAEVARQRKLGYI